MIQKTKKKPQTQVVGRRAGDKRKKRRAEWKEEKKIN